MNYGSDWKEILMKKIAILGSTGSIGTQTLEIVDSNKDIEVLGLTANSNIQLLYKQVLKYNPKVVAVMNKEKALELSQMLTNNKVEVLSGIEGLIEVAKLSEVDIVVTAVVGMIGLRPTVEAIKAGKDIALANKETLVTAGSIIIDLIKEYNVKLLPVDSEHSAIFQCLNGENNKEVNNIILTASGGPFRGKKMKDLENISVAQALQHPNWSMGSKITIDSATLMNKGLEVIEAKWLFDLNEEQIKVVVHQQSVIHSMVEFVDGSTMAQLGLPDMKLPIHYALYYPNRKSSDFPRMSLAKIGTLSFEEPDLNTFRCLKLAYDSIAIGGSMPTVVNAANEIAVSKFLNNKIGFLDIPRVIEYAMERHNVINKLNVESVIECEKWTHNLVESRW
jgi:1-deoxy-D-xylulose-5-phosphate reductoisomerase